MDSLGVYLQEISRYPLLSPKEEILCAKQIQAMLLLDRQQRAIASKLNRQPTSLELVALLDKSEQEIKLIFNQGQRAKKRMLSANLRFVVMVVKRYQNRGLELLDLIQEGSLGLCKSVEKFDPNKGYKFSTYTYWWIRQSIIKAITKQGRVIRLPEDVTESINKIKKVRQELSQSLNRCVSVAEIAQSTNIKIEKIQEYTMLSQKILSLDMYVGENNHSELIDLIQSRQDSLYQADSEFLSDILNGVFNQLSNQEIKVLTLKYGINSNNRKLSYEEIGQEVGCSRETIRQIHNKAILKLKRIF